MSARYSADGYSGALRALMPRGRIWSFEPGSVQARLLASLALSAERLDESAGDLLVDAFPGTADALLPEWEETLGLPDPCLGPDPTDDQRRDQLRARLAFSGGQSVPHFVAFAAALGFAVAITEYAPFRVGRSRVGQPIADASFAYSWLVTILSDATSAAHAAFRVGISHVGDPLASTSAGHAALECEMRRLAPAHTLLLFSY